MEIDNGDVTTHQKSRKKFSPVINISATLTITYYASFGMKFFGSLEFKKNQLANAIAHHMIEDTEFQVGDEKDVAIIFIEATNMGNSSMGIKIEIKEESIDPGSAKSLSDTVTRSVNNWFDGYEFVLIIETGNGKKFFF